MNRIGRMTWANIAARFLLTVITFSQSTETQYSNDSFTLNLNSKHSLRVGPQNNNSYWNFQSRPSQENVPLELGKEQLLDVKNFNNNVIETNVSRLDYEDDMTGTPSTEEILEYIYPKTWTWALIFFHCVVFIVGLVGNCLVCVAVYRNRTMRTVTNYFIVNLAVADFLVILFCLPPSVVWDVTSTWWFGTVMCKTVLYLQVRLLIKRASNWIILNLLCDKCIIVYSPH